MLLEKLQISTVDVLGISAAGPTALAFAQRHPDKVRKLILESPIATDWDEKTKRRSRRGFGRAEKFTWSVMHLLLQIFPTVMIKALMRDLIGFGTKRAFCRPITCQPSGCEWTIRDDADLLFAAERQHLPFFFTIDEV